MELSVALNTSAQEVIAHRRRLVAALRLRQYTEREIQQALQRQGERNPRTGQPWSLGIVHSDLAALRAEWQAEAQTATASAQGAVLAELREVRREAWQRHELALVLRSLRQEADLLALDAPDTVDISLRVRVMAEALGLDPEQAVREAERLVREGGRRESRR